MARAFSALEHRERADVFRTVAAESGRSANILEKDFWICWVLEALFSIPARHPMAFKGGTSLSKVYGVIDRFSEDVDITLDYQGFKDGFDPFAPGATKNQINLFGKRLKARVAGYAKDVIAPALGAATTRLATVDRCAVRVSHAGERVVFAYPSVVEEPNAYLRSDVLLEFGGRNVIVPSEEHQIAPDIAAAVPSLEYPVAGVTVLSPMRTFWEKATLVHVECHRRQLASRPDRLSRHWFDLACLVRHDIGKAALADRGLLEDVVRYKKVFFNSDYANYDCCLDGRLRLVPDPDQLPSLQSDYNEMRRAGIVGIEAPDFDTLMGRIRDLEVDVNRRA